MQQLSGLDTTFLHLESNSTPMHIGSLAIYDQSTAPGGRVTFKDILAFFESRLHKAPMFRQRLANVPMGLDKPYWTDDPDFDLEFHVRHIALPQPGDWRQLCIQAARLHSRPLDLNRPLWEAYIIEGLDNVAGVPRDAFALVTKIHHAAIDGVSGAEITAAIHDLAEVPVADDTIIQPWVPASEPGIASLLGHSALNTLKLPLRFARLLSRSGPELGKMVRGLAGKDLVAPTKAPRTRFNSNVSPHRVFDGRSFSLDEIKVMRQAVEGSKLNDVVVAVCGGALRKYLDAKGELPERSLIAMAPVNLRREDQSGTAGNQVTAMSLPIRSDIEDPLERLEAVVEESRAAKKLTLAAGAAIGPELAEFIPQPAGSMLAKFYASAGLADRLPPIFNTVITNVPGPAIPMYSMGSKMVTSFGLGPAVHGMGLFQPIISYNGQLTISVVACREMMPDPAFYSECLQASYDELKAAVDDKKPAPSKGDSGKKKRKTKKTE